MSSPTNPLTIAKLTSGYWITDPTGEVLEAPCGPYETIAEAHDDARGLWRTHLYGDQRDYWTSIKPRKQSRQMMAF